jgi:hypothetical protein
MIPSSRSPFKSRSITGMSFGLSAVSVCILCGDGSKLLLQTSRQFESLDFSLGSYNDPIPSQIPVVVPLGVPFHLVAGALALASIRSLDNVGLHPRLRQLLSSSMRRPFL